jgi:hypothetical protein
MGKNMGQLRAASEKSMPVDPVHPTDKPLRGNTPASTDEPRVRRRVKTIWHPTSMVVSSIRPVS